MDIKFKPWSSASKFFIPFHMGICLTVILILFSINKAEASDPNNDAYCLAQNMYFEGW